MGRWFASALLLLGTLDGPTYVPPPAAPVVQTSIAQHQASRFHDSSLSGLLGTPVIGVPYDALDLDAPALERASLPQRLRDLSMRRFREPGSQSDIASLVWRDVESLGYSRSAVAALAPREAINLASRVVGLMDYVDVDATPFLEEFGKLTIEESLRRGLGECNTFTGTLPEVVDVFRQVNHRLAHIEVGERIGGYGKVPHDWNAILIRYPDKVTLTFIDALAAKRGAGLGLQDPVLVPQTQAELRANIALELGEPFVAEQELRTGLSNSYIRERMTPRAFGSVALRLVSVAQEPARALRLLDDARPVLVHAQAADWLLLSDAFGQAHIALGQPDLAVPYGRIYASIADEIDAFSPRWVREGQYAPR